jgi:hypothetical protein
MNLVKTCKIHCLSKTLSMMTHMMGTAGNEAIINREKILSRGVIRDVPVLSGNAIRHRMIREPGALYLIRACGLEGKLTVDQANYLLNGGSLTESSTTENLSKIATMQELLPLYRLLGGSLRNQVIGGSLTVLRGLLVCEENREGISKVLPPGFDLPELPLRTCEQFIDGYQYTRGDARKRADADQILDEKQDEIKTNLMIYNGENVIPGSYFYHGFILQNISPLEIGALLHSLDQWQINGSSMGGSARIGHGQLHADFFFQPGEDFFGNGLDPEQLKADYVRHVETNKDRIVEWLNDVFPRGSEKKKGKNDDQKLENQLLP